MADEDPPPRKKRKKLARANPTLKTTKPTGAQLKVRLTNADAEKFGLDDSLLLEVDKVEWIQFNAPTAGYLYFLTSCILNCDAENIILERRQDGREADEEEEGWCVVEENDGITEGVYLVSSVDDFANAGVLHFDYIKASQGGRRSSKRVETPTKFRSMEPDTPDLINSVSANINATPTTSLGRINLDSTISPTLQSPSSGSKTAMSETDKGNVKKLTLLSDNEARKVVANRDKWCVVYGTAESECRNSHIIPKALFGKGTVLSGGYTFADENDPNVSLILCPDLDQSFSKFAASISMMDEDEPTFQIFLCAAAPDPTSFPPATYIAANQKKRRVN